MKMAYKKCYTSFFHLYINDKYKIIMRISWNVNNHDQISR